MKLKDAPFQAIKSGKKRVELRLYDEKRRSLRVGDLISFRNVTTGELLSTKIMAISVFPSFFELYKRYDKISMGYGEGELATPEDMYAYYSKDEIERYGVVGIEVAIK